MHGIHAWTHHGNKCNIHIHDPQRFLPTPGAQATAHLLSFSLYFLWFQVKRNHTVWTFLGLTSLSCFDILSCYCNALTFHSFSFLRSNLVLFFLSILCWWSPDLFPYFGYYENAGINIHIKVFLWVYAIISLGEIPESGIARSYLRCLIF